MISGLRVAEAAVGSSPQMGPQRVVWGIMECTLDVHVAAVSGVLITGVLALMLNMERIAGLMRRLRAWGGPHAADR
jgi:hypothetical protein